MPSLVDDLIGEIRLRRAGGRVARDSGFGKARGRRSRAGGSSFSARARNLWQVGQGSNAAVLKKIARGGTQTPGWLKAQLRYLFTKSHALFGNTIAINPDAAGLTAEQRRAIALDWSDGWRGKPKNGHTTHLLLSFRMTLPPKRPCGSPSPGPSCWATTTMAGADNQLGRWG